MAIAPGCPSCGQVCEDNKDGADRAKRAGVAARGEQIRGSNGQAYMHVYIAHATLTSPRYAPPYLVCAMAAPCQDIKKWVACTAHFTTRTHAQQSMCAMDLFRLLQERTT